jgi:hypothetical protein
MNTRLRAFVVGLVVVMGVGTLGTAVATGTTIRPRTVMLEKLNEVRSAHGLGVVRPALLLRLIAQRHSDDMVIRDYFSHTIPGGSYYWDHFRHFGIEDWVSPYASEILATNTHISSDSAAGTYAYKSFMASAPHRGAIRNCSYNTFGVGAYREGSRRDFAVTFSRQPTERTTGSTSVRTGPGTSYDKTLIVPASTRQFVFMHRTDASGRRWDSGYIEGVSRGWVLDSATK